MMAFIEDGAVDSLINATQAVLYNTNSKDVRKHRAKATAVFISVMLIKLFLLTGLPQLVMVFTYISTISFILVHVERPSTADDDLH